MKTILTIDWDYVVTAPLGAQTWAMMPDSPNEQFSHTVHDIIWLSMYGTMHKLKRDWNTEILSQPGYSHILSLIETMRCNTKDIAYGITHMLAYPYIISELGNSGEDYRLINIDFHSDMRRIQPSDKYVDCGNWVTALGQTGALKEYIWIRSPESSTMEIDYFNNTHHELDIHSYTWDNYKFPEIDRVFICKSPAWSPPHLDKDFLSLLEAMSKRFNLVNVDRNDEDRRLIQCDRFSDYEGSGDLQKMQQIYAGYPVREE